MRTVSRFFLLCLLTVSVWAKPVDFWKVESEKSGEASAITFSAKKEPAKGQGVLMWGHWPITTAGEKSPLEPTAVLAGLYKDLKDFHLLGRKEVAWGDRTSQLVAFRATADKRPVVARALFNEGEDGIHVLVLVSNPESQKDFSKEFERLQKGWDFAKPATSNVIYLP